jgi:hypothetical protein
MIGVLVILGKKRWIVCYYFGLERALVDMLSQQRLYVHLFQTGYVLGTT